MNLIIQGRDCPLSLQEAIAKATGGHQIQPSLKQVYIFTKAVRNPAFVDLLPMIHEKKLDWAFVIENQRLSDYKLMAFDMDSTLITIECIDELADFAGKKAEVAAVTEAAMRGELDYRESLRRRLGLLAGLDARVLAQVFSERLRLSPGVPELLEAARGAGLRTAILSGGFTYFTERLRIEQGFDFATSNELEISGGKLTGHVVGEIVDAEAKATHLARLRDKFGLKKEQVIAIGDGANDLLMMAEAGLSVAYCAKPAVRNQASIAINYCRLDSLLNIFSTE